MVFGGGLAGASVVHIVIRATDQFSKTFNKADKSIGNLTRSSRNLTKALGTVAIAGVAAVAVGVGLMVREANKAETAFAGVRKTVDLTEEGFKELEGRFKSLSEEIPVSFNALSSIGEIAGQLGVEGVDDLTKFTEVAASLGVTTNLSAEDAATAFARISNVMQEPLSDVDRMGSAVVDLGNNFATTESEIVQFAQRIASTGKIVGFTSADVFGISAALSSVGVEAEAGGTAIQQALLKMNDAVINGGEEMDLLAQTAGLSVAEFSSLWETDAVSAFTSFVDGLGKSGDEASNILAGLGLGGVRTQRAFLSMANAGDLLSEAIATSNNAFEENVALTEEAGKRFATTDSQLQVLKNSFTNTAASVGAEVKESFGDIMTEILPGVTQAFADFGKIFVEKIIPAMRFAFDAFRDLMAAFGTSEDGTSRVIKGIGLILQGLFTFIGLVIKGIATIVEFVKVLIEWGKVLANVVAQKAVASFNKFKIALQTVGLVFTILKNNALLAFEFIKLGAAKVANSVIGFFANMLNQAVNIINKLIRAANKIPGINIKQIGQVDFGRFKIDTSAIETRIGGLLTEQREAARQITINIETLSGVDVDEMADALRTKLNDLVNA